ncbi:ankyrin repeat domain-containing protein [Aspergillus affinis]|uniref:ankyrin repeat domain-containing protein n=1 Tax=Aspergillus affinis TaxID=1070780 RepID=UPI0022FF3186|nr:uncharacterized protein KD926_001401 [Aspergillus affinis]KAI9036707.1 hypothetical protein KD926_001401 [Aspergillus affinis]
MEARLNVVDQFGKTALHLTAFGGHLDVVQLLLSYGVDQHMKDDVGAKDIHLAVRGGLMETFQYLLTQHSHSNLCTGTSRIITQYLVNPFTRLFAHWDPTTLITPDFEMPDNDGTTLLAWAIEGGSEEILERTPLSRAAGKGNEPIIKLLLANGANLNFEDTLGRTAMFWAAKRGHESSINLLTADGIDYKKQLAIAIISGDKLATENLLRPILRLRPDFPQGPNVPRVAKHYSHDGPWVRDPAVIIEANNTSAGPYVLGTNMEEYRANWKKQRAERQAKLKRLKAEKRLHEIKILDFIIMWPPVDMMRRDGRTDAEIESALEKYYVGPQLYLQPGFPADPGMIERFGPDWGLNARGIYYRQHFSQRWVTPDCNLWVPSLDGIDWAHSTESSRRARAKTFLGHVLNNEKWRKSEYAWEADAWADVFDQMRRDPVLAIDKHEYNEIKQKRDLVTCLLAGEPKFVKRIPDATFGFVTFKPTDYQSAWAEWDLDHDRLEALLLQRHCGLIADPRWGGADLVFPFATYEAKGWSGDAREARRQGCSAGAAYLDLLDSLARQPGKVGKKRGLYQPARTRLNQVFVFTSFGAHWHILVGYKRRRLPKEYAGHEGFSDSVYIFQKIWSGRVVTQRKAWELLCLVDQIHLWGVTDFRDSVMQCLRPWHEFGRICYAHDVAFHQKHHEVDKLTLEGKEYFIIPRAAAQLGDWSRYLTADTREKLQERLTFHFREAYRRDQHATTHDWPARFSCFLDDCGPFGNPGYPLLSEEDLATHFREIHGKKEAEITSILCLRDEVGESETDVSVSLPPMPQRKRRGDDEPGPCAKRYKLISSEDIEIEHVVEFKDFRRRRRSALDDKEISCIAYSIGSEMLGFFYEKGLSAFAKPPYREGGLRQQYRQQYTDP